MGSADGADVMGGPDPQPRPDDAEVMGGRNVQRAEKVMGGSEGEPRPDETEDDDTTESDSDA